MKDVEFQMDFNVSRETIQDLKIFVQELSRWTKAINLVSPKSIEDVWQRHIADSAQLWPHISQDASGIVDLGSGGGMPGIVLATISKQLQPHRHFTLVESDSRKAAFLTQISSRLNLNTKVIADRTENVDHLDADILTCRGYAPLDKALSHIHRHLRARGTALLLKGENADTEIEQAKRNWNFTVQKIQSITHTGASVLKIWDIEKIRV